MEIETLSGSCAGSKRSGVRRGLVLVHTGNSDGDGQGQGQRKGKGKGKGQGQGQGQGKGKGKAKSSAAFGLALRAHGRGKEVAIRQFTKVPSARFGEHRRFEPLGLPLIGRGDGFRWKRRDLERSAQPALDGGVRAEAAIRSGEHFVVVRDEVMYPLRYGWVPPARRPRSTCMPATTSTCAPPAR